MDAGLYLNLREELQADATRVERQLEELRRTESFLLRRIKTAGHVRSYQAVLGDLEHEITEAETEHVELLHLERFVTRSLIKGYGDELPAVSEQNPDRPPPRNVVPEPPAIVKGSDARPKPRPEEREATPPRSGVEFDEAGFPIAGPSNGKAAIKKNPAKVPRAANPPAEPPTVVFDENGFPLNLPPADSMNTIAEPPKRDLPK